MEGIDTALAALRISLGLLMIGHGTQKLFGWFGGYGVRGTGGFFASLGYPAPVAFAAVAGLTEAGAGALLAAGLITPLAVAGLIGLFVNIIVAAHLRNGFWNHNSPAGYEFPLTLAVASAAFALTGPGAYSLDAVLGWNLAGFGWLAASVGAGLAAALATLALRRAPVAAGAPAVAAVEVEEERLAG